MLAPLSWLRDFAPFPDDTAALTSVLDDLGLVVEGVEQVGEGLGDVVVARVDSISAIEGADKIRLVVVEAGDGPLEIVCGAQNFAVGDRVPLAPIGAVLPGNFEIAKRTMLGVTSFGMLCSGKELGLSDDGAGLMVLGPEVPGAPGTPLTEVLGLEADTVFDITVEGNRPDAWCMAGIARDLAARLGLPFTLPDPPAPSGGVAVAELASAVVDAPEFCPRLTVAVLTEVTVAPSPQWMANRLTLAGMRPINNVVDASNYVMLERGQPTHPYDRQRLPGHGLVVRAARPGEQLETLDGTTRTLGVSGGTLGDTGEDCLICDANDAPVGIAGIMGGASSEIAETTTEVLLEAAYFTPMVIARSAKRLGLRTEASVRFERGCDPWGIEGSVRRFCQLLAETSPGLTVADGLLDVRGEVPTPFEIDLPLARVQSQLGVDLSAEAVRGLIEPIGFTCATVDGDPDLLRVTVPTNRPDVRRAPFGIDDVIEEVARTFGYGNVPRRSPAWPQPGHLEPLQRARRFIKNVLNGLGVSEAWTDSFVSAEAHAKIGLTGPAVQVSNPLIAETPYLRRSLMPGLLDALAYNAARRQAAVRLFEVGVVFSHPSEGHPRLVERAGAGGAQTAELPGEREMLSAVFALGDDDAADAVAAWQVVSDAFRLAGVRLVAPADGAEAPAGLHPTRSARLRAANGVPLGTVGEIDPDVASAFGLTHAAGAGVSARRIGWLELDLGLLFDETVIARHAPSRGAVSRFPSSDIDLAFVVADSHPADALALALAGAGGEVLESVTLFDVYRGVGVPDGQRSLAYRLRFCSPDHTMTDSEVGELRTRCIEAAVQGFGAALR